MLEITISLLGVLAVIWFLWRWKHTSFFLDLGIPGPSPNIFFGNILELYIKGPFRCHEEWVKRYGRIVGYYYGMNRVLLVADPQMLKNIYIKDFSKFIDREPFNPLVRLNRHDSISQNILNLKGQEWKETRSILTPTFTTAKMKRMAVTMNESIETMVNILHENAVKGETIDIHETYQRLTMDVIARTAFGINLDVQTNSESRILKTSKILFRTPFYSIFIFIGLCFPLLRLFALRCQEFIGRLYLSGVDPIKYLQHGIKSILKFRREHPEYRKQDLLQLMIETKINSNETKINVQKLEAGGVEDEKDDINDGKETQKVMTLEDGKIIATSFVVFLAGYETTSTALAFTSYLLAKHPNIQEKLHNEIDELVINGYQLEYSTVNKLPYLEKVFNESMRIYPPVWSFTNRYAVENVQYGPLKIPKGTIIQAPTFLLHRDPDFWPDPETFDPERFNTNPNSDGIIFFPFGIGPRNCLGMRFAQMEAKLALAHTVYNFKLHLDETIKDDIPFTIKLRMISPTNGVKIKLESRNKDNI